MKYLSYVDGLRAVAIAAVVAFHVAPSAVPGGYAGVDVFFVISGFLITRLIAGEIEERRFSILGFWGRRARRLIPAALVCFLAIAVLGYFVLLPDAYLDFGGSLAAASLMYANIHFSRRAGYFDVAPDQVPLLHTWSLSVEDQFYLVWPLLLLALLPVSRRIVAIAIVVAVGLSLAWAESLLSTEPAKAFFLIQSRASELLIGAFLALVIAQVRLPRLAAEIAGAAGLMAVFAAFFILGPNTRFPGVNALPVCLATALVIAAGYHHQTWATRALGLGPVVFVGLISYSLYLWHWPLLVLAHYAAERPLAAWELGVIVLAAAAIATLSWKYVEQPFRHRATAEPMKAVGLLRLALAPMLVLIVVGVAIRYGDGWPWRYEPAARELFKQASSGNPLRRACDGFANVFSNDATCNFGRQRSGTAGYDVIVVGDSMADHWVPAVVEYAERAGLAGRQVTNGGCPALLGGADLVVEPNAVKNTECRNYRNALAAFLAANQNLKMVVMSGFWAKWLGWVDEHGGQGRFERALSETVHYLRSRGIVVLIIDQVPIYPALPMRCVASVLAENADVGRCGLPAAVAGDQVKTSSEIFGRVVDPSKGVYFASPRAFLCEKPTCDLIEDRIFLYRDRGHLSGIGARHLAAQIKWPDLGSRRAEKAPGDAAALRIVR